jgi:SNF2 family DNA or RNA helicase
MNVDQLLDELLPVAEGCGRPALQGGQQNGTVATDQLDNFLRDYQREDARFLTKTGRAILGHDPGLGKTRITIVAAQRLSPQGQWLIISPKVALGVWENETRQILNEGITIWNGSPAKRQKAWSNKRRIVATNFALAKKLLKLQDSWDVIIIDESHYIRNRKTDTFKNAIKKFYSRYLFCLSGTPVVNGAKDLWTSLNLLNPRRYASYWRFVQQYCHVYNDGYGYKVEGTRNPDQLQRDLSPVLIRRKKEDVLKELPAKQRMTIPLEMDPNQQKIYDQIAEEMLARWGEDEGDGEGGKVLVPNKIAQITRLRQVLVTPALFGGPHISATFDALQEALEVDFESGNPAIIFTPFAKALPYIGQVVKECGGKFGTIKGGMKAEDITRLVAGFQRYQNPKKALICSLLAGQSFTATAATVAYFVGYDWVPANCLQAEDRIHRIGQHFPVRVCYFTYKGTIDDHLLDVLNRKTRWNNLAISPKKLLLGSRYIDDGGN